MTAATVLFLPAGDAGYRWLALEDGRVTAGGDGLPPGGAPVVAVAPADAVTLHWAELPARSPAQARAAARLVTAEASAAPGDELHVAVGEEGDGERAVAVVASGAIAGWLMRLAADGIDPDAVVPAPLLLPRPEEGFVRADLAGQAVVRGRTSGFADEARLTELVTGDATPATVPRDALEVAIAAAVARPPLDLRQGPFARRRRFAIDWRLVRRLARLAAAIVLVTLVIQVARLVRLDMAADAAEAEADALARTALPATEQAGDADRQLAARLSGLRGPGEGFTRTAAAAFQAVRAVPGSEVRALSFTDAGALRLQVATETEGQANALVGAVERAGFRVVPSTFTQAGDRLTGEIVLEPRR
jgi:general secretion pathway protein L